MRIDERILYMFSELTEEVQEKIVQRYRDWNVDNSYWYECVLDDAKQIGSLMGIEIKNVSFALDGSDYGACFDGRYTYQKGASAAIRQHAPMDAELHRIADGLREWQRRHFYGLDAIAREHNQWQHTMIVDVRDHDGCDVDEDTEEGVAELLRDFADWIYRRLAEEYEYLTSDAAVVESLEANELEFTADGELA